MSALASACRWIPDSSTVGSSASTQGWLPVVSLHPTRCTCTGSAHLPMHATEGWRTLGVGIQPENSDARGIFPAEPERPDVAAPNVNRPALNLPGSTDQKPATSWGS